MTNFINTHDDLTSTVRQQLGGFADLPLEQYTNSGARLTSQWVLDHDPRNPFADSLKRHPLAPGTEALELWLTQRQMTWSRDEGMVYVEVKRMRGGGEPDAIVARSLLPMRPRLDDDMKNGRWITAPMQYRFYLPLTDLALPRLAPDAEYSVRIALDRRSDGDKRMRTSNTRDVANFTLRTTSTGDVWPY